MFEEPFEKVRVVPTAMFNTAVKVYEKNWERMDKEKEEANLKKPSVWNIIKARLPDDVKNKLKGKSEYRNRAAVFDVVWKIRTILVIVLTEKSGVEAEDYLDCLLKVINCEQRTNEDIEKYYERFTSEFQKHIQVCEAKKKLPQKESDMVASFIKGLDRQRYSVFVETTRNWAKASIKQYPVTIVEAYERCNKFVVPEEVVEPPKVIVQPNAFIVSESVGRTKENETESSPKETFDKTFRSKVKMLNNKLVWIKNDNIVKCKKCDGNHLVVDCQAQQGKTETAEERNQRLFQEVLNEKEAQIAAENAKKQGNKRSPIF